MQAISHALSCQGVFSCQPAPSGQGSARGKSVGLAKVHIPKAEWLLEADIISQSFGGSVHPRFAQDEHEVLKYHAAFC